VTDNDLPENATQALRDTAAMLLAGGSGISEVAAQLSRAPATIQSWLRDPEFQNLLRHYKERIVLASNRAMTLFLLESERTARSMIALAQDHEHNRHYDACKYILDHLMPQKTVHEVHTRHDVPESVTGVLDELAENLKQLRNLRSGTPADTPTTLNGKQAIEAYGIGEG
jgi:hypothetical protein